MDRTNVVSNVLSKQGTPGDAHTQSRRLHLPRDAKRRHRLKAITCMNTHIVFPQGHYIGAPSPYVSSVFKNSASEGLAPDALPHLDTEDDGGLNSLEKISTY